MLKNQLLEIFPIGPEFPDHRRFDPVTAISGGIGLVGNIAGGIMGSGAAKKAAAIQQQAAQAASDRVGVAVGQANAPIAEATQRAQEMATAGGNRVIDTAGQGAANATAAAGQANALLNPYTGTGADASAALRGEIANTGKAPTLDQLQMDPGYAFRAQQGQIALDRSAAARGGALSGEAAKAMAAYSQGLASQEYQNAFNRFTTSTQNRFGNLMSLSNSGQAAAGQHGANLTGAAQYGGNLTTGAATTALGANEFAGQAGMQGANEIGQNTLNGANMQANYLTGGANAQASGIVGSANALGGGIAGGANAVSGALTAYQTNQTAKANNNTMLNLLQNPAVRK